MPPAAASALRPMATRTPLMAITAVQALCRSANRIPDHPKILRRATSVGGTSAVGAMLDSAVEARGIDSEFYRMNKGASNRASIEHAKNIPAVRGTLSCYGFLSVLVAG